MKNRIVTMYPYSPTFTNEYRITHLVYYLSRMFDTEPRFLMTEKYMPIKIYHFFEIEKSLTFFKYTKSRYENIFWFSSHPPLKPLGKLAKRIKKNNLGKVIFDFYDDDFLDKARYGEEYCLENKKDYFDALETLFSYSLTLATNKEHLDYYEEQGLQLNDYLVLSNASDPNLFRKTPLPNTKVIGHIGSFGTMQGAKTRGLFLLMDAFELVLKKYKDAKLLLCGEFGSDVRTVVEKRIRDWNTEIYWERVPHYWVPEIYQKCYVFVRPTLILARYIKTNSKIYASASGMDAAAAARPVISTTQNAIINDNGFVCETNAEDMAAKICKLLANRKLATELGLKGRKAIETEHNWENRARILYEHLISLYRLDKVEPY